MAGPGRGQREPMERLVRLMAVLSDAGTAGVAGEDLIVVGRYGDADPVSQLNRDFGHLRAQGWQIDNIAEPGSAARYRLVKGDNRLRLRLTPGQLAALQRAALLADRAELTEKLGLPVQSRPAEVVLQGHGDELGPVLDTVVDALRERRVLHFRYKGRGRTVQPAAVRHRNGQWYLTGAEQGAPGRLGDLKSYVVARMSEVASEEPGSAPRVDPDRLDLHPMRWQADPPVEVVLRTPAEYVADVERWLLAPASVAVTDGVATMTYLVTHRAALRQRLYMLGPRVELVGPDDVRRELLDELREMAL